ncbi:uncharacterized protein DS421_12g377710 [Arachis hypogaea]|nr:uncharacterized protein DS421_12g377710 [Arachis hypogaea]
MFINALVISILNYNIISQPYKSLKRKDHENVTAILSNNVEMTLHLLLFEAVFNVLLCSINISSNISLYFIIFICCINSLELETSIYNIFAIKRCHIFIQPRQEIAVRNFCLKKKILENVKRKQLTYFSNIDN